ncbi:TetR/AcrR family transcriptional regulator [Porphyromonas pogonae]|uniref:TetR/AcrR family transcriptional regulator n=1 Tax=Porphyromonas pogonae TaxID=867595 RepID=UPI002E794D5E|nr:TetR/AcrR family transcriptional regulator [Porphyromonas pogonae]
MQKIKDDTRQILLQTAKEAFLEKGFKAVSMREISYKSGVGLSNIYNYFESKDEMLALVLQPFLTAFNDMMTRHNDENSITLDVFTSQDFQRRTIEDFVQLIARYRKELRLLLCASHGSCFENFRETLIEENTRIGLEYIALMGEKYPHVHSSISPFFIHITCTWWVSLLEEIAVHEKLSHEEIENFIADYVCYGTAGWRALMKA